MPEETLLKIEERHNGLLEKNPEFRNYCPAVLSYDEGFLEFCKNKDILNYVEQLIGSDFALWNSSFLLSRHLTAMQNTLEHTKTVRRQVTESHTHTPHTHLSLHHMQSY